ncbi:hypothetical protein BU15DRAFT_68589, partial [Melanogaster broomeanus]
RPTKDLVYRGRRLAKGSWDGSELTQEEEDEASDADGDQGEGSAKKAWVLAVYVVVPANVCHPLSCTRLVFLASHRNAVSLPPVHPSIASTTRPSDMLPIMLLLSHNVIVKAKNFLVFQGGVEAVAPQSAKELTRLIEQISGSLELAPDYEKVKEAQERATENATFNFTKRREITGEIKQYREQKGEAERFEDLCWESALPFAVTPIRFADRPCERTNSSSGGSCTKCSTSKEALEGNAREIQTESKTLAGLRADQQQHDKALEDAGRTKLELAQPWSGKKRNCRKLRKPSSPSDEKIKHATRKSQNAQTMHEQIGKHEERTIIHKSGLMTSGRSTHGSGKKWEEKDVQGLIRLQDNLMAQLQELSRSKPRGKADDNIIAEITRLDSAITVTKDDMSIFECTVVSQDPLRPDMSDRQALPVVRG